VGNSLSLWCSFSLSPCRSRGPHFSWQEQRGIARGCLILIPHVVACTRASCLLPLVGLRGASGVGKSVSPLLYPYCGMLCWSVRSHRYS
jgi:hypothetical protein